MRVHTPSCVHNQSASRICLAMQPCINDGTLVDIHSRVPQYKMLDVVMTSTIGLGDRTEAYVSCSNSSTTIKRHNRKQLAVTIRPYTSAHANDSSTPCVHTTKDVPGQTTLEPTAPIRHKLHDGKEIGIARAPEHCSSQDDQRSGPNGPPTLHRWIDP